LIQNKLNPNEKVNHVWSNYLAGNIYFLVIEMKKKLNNATEFRKWKRDLESITGRPIKPSVLRKYHAVFEVLDKFDGIFLYFPYKTILKWLVIIRDMFV